jgi:hypothetical protein
MAVGKVAVHDFNRQTVDIASVAGWTQKRANGVSRQEQATRYR